ncbi:MAG: hypothetical protein PGN09_01560 [Sphingomonas fennica]
MIVDPRQRRGEGCGQRHPRLRRTEQPAGGIAVIDAMENGGPQSANGKGTIRRVIGRPEPIDAMGSVLRHAFADTASRLPHDMQALLDRLDP